jgi:hypothetical protein
MTQMGAATSLGGHRPLLLAKLDVPATQATTVARPRLEHLLDGVVGPG